MKKLFFTCIILTSCTLFSMQENNIESKNITEKYLQAIQGCLIEVLNDTPGSETQKMAVERAKIFTQEKP